MHSSHSFKLGKLAPRHDPRTLKFRSYLAQLPPTPVAADWTTKVPSWGMLANDSVGDCTCFPAGTRVRMADGTTKNIEQVSILDNVYSAECNAQTVMSVMARYVNEQLFTVNAWGHSHLKCTAEHPILTKRGYVPAKDINASDWIALPVLKAISKTGMPEIDTAPFFEKEAVRRIQHTGYRHWRGRSDVIVEVKNVPKTIKLTADFGYIIGLFLSEGCTSQNSIRWTFGGHEKNTLVAALTSKLETELAISGVVRQRPNKTIDVVVCGKDWRILFETLCAKGAAGKQMHKALWTGGADFYGGVYNGWMAGDGHHQRGADKGTTVSHALALDMFNVAASLGLNPSIHGRQPKPSAGIKSARFRWDVSVRDALPKKGEDVGVYWDKAANKWVANGCKNGASVNLGRFMSRTAAAEVASAWRKEHSIIGNGMSYFDGHTMWKRVRSVDTEPFSGYVFNLNVTGDNSYTAESIGVHNCASAAHLLMLWTSLAGTELIPADADVLAIYTAITGYNPADPNTDQGANELDVLNYWRNNGILGHKITAFVQVEHDKLDHVRAAINLFGGVYAGVLLPDSAMTEFDHGQLWSDVSQTAQDGHAIPLVGYDADGFWAVTWGRKVYITNAWAAKYFDETYAVLSPAWIQPVGVAPSGFGEAQLMTDLSLITG